jgi:hypothetical protein
MEHPLPTGIFVEMPLEVNLMTGLRRILRMKSKDFESVSKNSSPKK